MLIISKKKFVFLLLFEPRQRKEEKKEQQKNRKVYLLVISRVNNVFFSFLCLGEYRVNVYVDLLYKNKKDPGINPLMSSRQELCNRGLR
jgi:hypothetical protein